MNMYVSNLNSNTTDADLRKAFASFGLVVVSANVIFDKDTGASRGFAFVEMQSEHDVKQAIKNLNNSQLNGNNISVVVAHPREEKGKKVF